ncbi:hypothetical protein ACA910_003729 [Epithemia clementina (nom. ined.)]
MALQGHLYYWHHLHPRFEHRGPQTRHKQHVLRPCDQSPPPSDPTSTLSCEAITMPPSERAPSDRAPPTAMNISLAHTASAPATKMEKGYLT